MFLSCKYAAEFIAFLSYRCTYSHLVMIGRADKVLCAVPNLELNEPYVQKLEFLI